MLELTKLVLQNKGKKILSKLQDIKSCETLRGSHLQPVGAWHESGPGGEILSDFPLTCPRVQ